MRSAHIVWSLNGLQLASCLVQALRTTSDDDDFLLVLTAESLARPTTSIESIGRRSCRIMQVYVSRFLEPNDISKYIKYFYMEGIATPKVPSNIGLPAYQTS